VSANADFLRRGYEALERGDLDTFEELARERIGPDFEFHLVWDGRVLKGWTGTQEWIADTRETWEGYSQKVEEIVDRGDRVLVVVSISGRGSESGVPVEQELAVVWTFEGERARTARSYTSRAEAFAALADEEPPSA
jgi:ketosteroid isomerase-like protein